MTQVGLTTFVYSPHKRKYIGRPFNINLCQRSIVDESSDAHYFNMNGETIAFLRKHHFDFNHQLKTGLSFYQLSKKSDLRQRCKAFVQKLVRVAAPVKEPTVFQTKGLSLKNQEVMKAHQSELVHFMENDEREEATFKVESALLRQELSRWMHANYGFD